jgi:hypothetical protein
MKKTKERFRVSLIDRVIGPAGCCLAKLARGLGFGDWVKFSWAFLIASGPFKF